MTTRVRAQLAVWLTGITVFFSDSANPLILGPLYAPLFDRLKLSREKLAYLIDSTALPICILVPITSWAAYVLSLLGRAVADMPLDTKPTVAYLGSIPFQFYPLASLLLVPLIGRFGLDFGPMAKAEARSTCALSYPTPQSLAWRRSRASSSSESGPLPGCWYLSWCSSPP